MAVGAERLEIRRVVVRAVAVEVVNLKLALVLWNEAACLAGLFQMAPMARHHEKLVV
jgi:hypothetical protein